MAFLSSLLGCGTESDRSTAEAISTTRASGLTSWSEPVSLEPPTINTSFNDQQPALSKDGLSLYFASNRSGTPGPGPNDLWVSHRDCLDILDCPWSEPINLGVAVNTEFNDASPSLSRDGHWLFFLSNRPGGFGGSDIWVAWRKNVHDDFGWETPMNLGPGVNTAGFEGGASYFENDGGAPQLYFNRNPTGAGTGGDIYVSEQAANGVFGPAVPVEELNSPYTDQRPSITHSGLDIYFHSDRLQPQPGLLTGSDIWVSHRDCLDILDCPWSAPTNVGPPVNTSGREESFPFIASHGGTEWLYFTRNIATSPARNLDLFVSTRTRGNAHHKRAPQGPAHE